MKVAPLIPIEESWRSRDWSLQIRMKMDPSRTRFFAGIEGRSG